MGFQCKSVYVGGGVGMQGGGAVGTWEFMNLAMLGFGVYSYCKPACEGCLSQVSLQWMSLEWVLIVKLRALDVLCKSVCNGFPLQSQLRFILVAYATTMDS